ncbi:MAG: protein O-GlcNAc transferase, partial [Humisphaera sp.]|nr:protein O-GlcNAc transferase [Humisphaera sp.]
FVPDLAAHLGLYRRIDIALDTFPYNGTTTTCEAMWMGVPVITLVGKYHLSRVGRSLLTAVGLADLIAQSPQEYIAIAARLAGDNERRRQLRRDLRAQMRRSPLMDSLRFARNVESAYREMWKRYARG